ncbi:MAG: hypothetical protein LBB05_04135 [Puniceicoccales bacterium]|jgi:hypothetical protein|nr:hypothetical protein [Puniceicoccales bacterium]
MIDDDCDILARLIEAIHDESPTFLKIVLSQVVAQAIQEKDADMLIALSNALKVNEIYQPLDNESSLLPLAKRDGKTIVFITLDEALKGQLETSEDILTLPHDNNCIPFPQATHEEEEIDVLEVLIKTLFTNKTAS